MCWNTYFYSVFEHQPKNAKKWPKKNDNFWHFPKHGLIQKKPVLLQPPFWPKISVFFKLSVLKPKTLMLNKKHNLKWGNSKDKKKELETKKRQETKKRENISEKKKLAIEYFDVVPFMKEKQRRKKNKERDRNKEPKDSKKQRQEGRKKENKKERETGKEKQNKREAQKRLREKERERLKINKKCPFLGKTRFFLY